MTAEAWTAIGTGIVILIAIAASTRHLRREIRAMRADPREDIRDLRERMGQLEAELRGSMSRLEAEMRERMAKVEGLLEGLREAISGRHAA